MAQEMHSEVPNQDLAPISALVQNTYRSTWNDFYEWEQDYSRQTLLSLARVSPPSPSQAGMSLPSTSSSKKSSPVTAPIIAEYQLDMESENFTIVDYTNSDGAPHITTLSIETIEVVPQFEPCAPYEVCTPANRNIYVGDDSEYMPFIPLTDDPKFNHLLHAGDYRYFEWQLPNRDPDCKSAHR